MLQLLRAQLILHDKTRMKLRRSLEKAKQCGFLKYRKKLHAAVDTMAIPGAGAVKDTYNLLVARIMKLIRALADVREEEPKDM
jgi:hypothetical protein